MGGIEQFHGSEIDFSACQNQRDPVVE